MTRYVPNEPACPVELEVLGKIMRAPTERVLEIIDELDDMRCAHLAAFCFQRNHLREIGMLIAAHCSERALRSSGSIGEMLVEQRYVQAA